jgi:hypothetical protein
MTNVNFILPNAANQYAAQGQRVFPCIEKRPATKNGCKDATCDESQVRQWWATNPRYNIGLPTGKANNITVLDVDNKNGKRGDLSLAALESKHGALPVTLMARTPSGGTHYFFRYVEGLTNSVDRLGVGLDIRTEGGYVLVAPSVINGVAYQWLNDAPIAELPGWAVEALKPTPPPVTIESKRPVNLTRKFTRILSFLKSGGEGERNKRLYWAACRLFENRFTLSDVENALTDIAIGLGLKEREVINTIRSAQRKVQITKS